MESMESMESGVNKVGRREFVDELKSRLRKLPYDEIKEAVDYYEGYFDDAGEENEQAVLAELGSPSAVAAQIIAGFAVKGAGAEKSVKKSWFSAWHVILALFASPVAVPLAVAVGLTALALIFTLSAVILTFFIAGAALFIGGVVLIIISIPVIFQSVPTTIFLFGSGLMLTGFGTAITIATAALSRKCYGWLAKQVGNFVLRRKVK